MNALPTHLPFCPACLQSLNGLSVCAHCGWYSGTRTDSLYLPPGTVVKPPYQVAKVLGHGGFGVTYLGWDANLQIKVAIKEYLPRDLAHRSRHNNGQVMADNAASGQFQAGLTRFLDEARTLAKFQQHPGIVSVLSFFPAFGTGYMVMEFVEGQTLKSYLDRNGRLNWTQTLDIFMQVMDSLRALHKADLLHGDVAPDNIYICGDGRIKLLDFGAVQSSVSTDQEAQAEVILKPGFAPEEQYRNSGQRGGWSDVYSVAASMYFSLTAQIPPDALTRRNRDTLKPLSAWGIHLPPAIEDTLMSALAIDASQRPQTIESLQQLLLPVTVQPKSEPVSQHPFDPGLPQEPTALLQLERSRAWPWLFWFSVVIVCISILALMLGSEEQEVHERPVGELPSLEQSVQSNVPSLPDNRIDSAYLEREAEAAAELKRLQQEALRRFEQQRGIPESTAKPPSAWQADHMRSLCDEWGATMDCQ
jgi:serine/threonine protein kinase